MPATAPLVSIASISISEGADAEFLITLDSPSSFPLVFSPFLESRGEGSGYAALGQDTLGPLQFSSDGGLNWSNVRGQVTIPAGRISAWIKVATVNDPGIEPNEVFGISTGPITWGSTAIPAVTAIASIVNNDGVPRIRAANVNALVVGQGTVFEKGLRKVSDTSESVYGTIAVEADQGIKSVTIGGYTLPFSQFPLLTGNPVTVNTGEGSLVLNGYAGDEVTGTISYYYTLKSPVNQPYSTSSTDSIELSVTSEANAVSDAAMVILIVDDVPQAANAINPPSVSITLEEADPPVNGERSSAANFSSYFSSSLSIYGADGPGSLSYSLDLSGSNVPSGLFALDPADVSNNDGDGFGQGSPILLNKVGGEIIGAFGGTNYLRIKVDPFSGQVNFSQFANVWHSGDVVSLSSNAITLTQTVTDFDGDLSTANFNLGVNGRLSIRDDSPRVITANVAGADTLAVDEFAIDVDAFGIFSDNFSPAISYGSDGAGSILYTLVLSGSNVSSGLYAPGLGNLPGNAIVLNQSNGVIRGSSGSTTYFTIRANSSTGEVVLDQTAEIYHPNSDQLTVLSTATGAISLRVTVTDADGDTAFHNLDLGASGAFKFRDDAPLSVSSLTVNEGSPFAVFTVSGNQNQQVRLSLTDQNSDGVDLSVIEVLQNGVWVSYSGGLITLGNGGSLLVRVAISPEQEDVLDCPELFSLAVTNSYGRVFKGTGTINDEGAGDYFAPDNTTPISATPPGVVLDNDNPVLKLTLESWSNSGTVSDNTTSNGLPELTLSAPANSSNQITVIGVNNSLLDPATYTVREVTRIDRPGLSYYTITLKDSQPSRAGIQGFGDYFLGEATSNNPNLGDGEYGVRFREQTVDRFFIRTVKAPPSCLQDIFGKRLSAPAVVTESFLSSLNTTFYGYRRVPNSSGTGGDDNLFGSIDRSDTLTGKGGSDVLNGVGNRFANGVFNPTVGTPGSLSQVDTLTGGSGVDYFQLGDSAGCFYARNKSNDYATITDFDSGEGLILWGKKEDYRVRYTAVKGRPAQMSLFLGDISAGELVAQLRGPAITAMSSDPLNAPFNLIASSSFL